MATINIPTPNFANIKANKDSFNGLKFFGVIAVVLVAVYAGFQAWIVLPPVDTIGGLMGAAIALALVAGIVIAANADNTWVRMLALSGAFIAGLLLRDQWNGLGAFFSGLSLQEIITFFISLIVLIGFALWVSHKS